MNIAALIVAAGLSERMGGGEKKEYRCLPGDNDGKQLTVLGAAFAVFARNPRISTIVLVYTADSENGESAAKKAIGTANETYKKEVYFVPGGSNRRLSVYHGLCLLEGFKPDYVLIHDGARPWIKDSVIDRVIDAAIDKDAAIPVVPMTETPKEIDGSGFVKNHLKRCNFVCAQTPQCFIFNKIFAAHKKAAEEELTGSVEWTDDAEIYGKFEGPVAVVDGDVLNKKITFKEDLKI
jgi:2-C-methyl-D-erythritol 4-phosphate cytidylyltransferase